MGSTSRVQGSPGPAGSGSVEATGPDLLSQQAAEAVRALFLEVLPLTERSKAVSLRLWRWSDPADPQDLKAELSFGLGDTRVTKGFRFDDLTKSRDNVQSWAKSIIDQMKKLRFRR